MFLLRRIEILKSAHKALRKALLTLSPLKQIMVGVVIKTHAYVSYMNVKNCTRISFTHVNWQRFSVTDMLLKIQQCLCQCRIYTKHHTAELSRVLGSTVACPYALGIESYITAGAVNFLLCYCIYGATML